jgi:hypothetical protein
MVQTTTCHDNAAEISRWLVFDTDDYVWENAFGTSRPCMRAVTANNLLEHVQHSFVFDLLCC